MNDLENARKEIEQIDRELAELFERRMEMSALIGKYKAENGLPVRDPDRERMLTEKNLSYLKNAELQPYYADFLRKVIDLSCEVQRTILHKKDRFGEEK